MLSSVRENYMYILYTPNLGLTIAVFIREREQGHFKGSIEGAEGALGEHQGSMGSMGSIGSMRNIKGA